jgi:hypothetical protein
MAQTQDYGAFSPVMNLVRKWVGVYNRLNQPIFSKQETNSGTLPKEWEDANKRSIAAQLKTENGQKTMTRKLARRKSSVRKSAN